jgi:hypothetical protein
VFYLFGAAGLFLLLDQCSKMLVQSSVQGRWFVMGTSDSNPRRTQCEEFVSAQRRPAIAGYGVVRGSALGDHLASFWNLIPKSSCPCSFGRSIWRRGGKPHPVTEDKPFVAPGVAEANFAIVTGPPDWIAQMVVLK